MYVKQLTFGVSLIVLCLALSAKAGELPCSQITSGAEKSGCLYALGLSSISDKKYKEAIELFANRIKMLGQDYNKDGRAIDDTGQKLTLAKIEEQKDHLEVSANLYKGVLDSRIHLVSDSAN